MSNNFNYMPEQADNSFGASNPPAGLDFSNPAMLG